ncbi:PR-1-like protein, partial [Mycena leptocephala]
MHRSFSQILKLCCVFLLLSASTAAISMNTGEFVKTYLAAQNSVWAKHGVWADGCVFQHSAGTLGPFCENLAAGTGDFTIQDAINAWTSEASATCFPTSFGPAQYYVCGYFPAGNVIGQFGANVQA